MTDDSIADSKPGIYLHPFASVLWCCRVIYFHVIWLFAHQIRLWMKGEYLFLPYKSKKMLFLSYASCLWRRGRRGKVSVLLIIMWFCAIIVLFLSLLKLNWSILLFFCYLFGMWAMFKYLLNLRLFFIYNWTCDIHFRRGHQRISLILCEIKVVKRLRVHTSCNCNGHKLSQMKLTTLPTCDFIWDNSFVALALRNPNQKVSRPY